MNENIPAPGLERSAEDRLFAAMPTAASLMAAIEMWDTYAPSHLRGLLRCQVAEQPEAPPVARATLSVAAPFVSAVSSPLPTHTGTFAQGLAQFGLAPTKRFQGDSFVVFTYNPNEARDPQGEWTAGGSTVSVIAKGEAGPRIREGLPTTAEVQALAGRKFQAMSAHKAPSTWENMMVYPGYTDWVNNLTDDQRTVMTRYQSGAKLFNQYLRHDKQPNKDMLQEMDAHAESGEPFTIDEAVAELQGALMVPAPTNIRAFRGGHVPQALKIGDMVQDDGFVSTSLSDSEAFDFVKYGNAPSDHHDTGFERTSGLIAIDVPKGSPAGYLDANQPLGEQELLLPHGATFAYMGEIDAPHVLDAVNYDNQRLGRPPVKIKRFLYIGPMQKQPSMAHFKHELSDLDEPGNGDKAAKYVWSEGDLRRIGHVDMGNTATFVFNPEEARDEAGKWTTGGPHVAVAPKVDRELAQSAPDTASAAVSAPKSNPRTLAPFRGTVAQAEETARSLGVESVDYGAAKEPAKAEVAAALVTPALQAVAALHLPVPRTIYAGHASALVGEGAVAAYIPSTDSLVLNTDHRFWDTPSDALKFSELQEKTGWWVPGGPVGVMVHELGHCAAEKADTSPGSGRSSSYKFGPNRWSGAASSAGGGRAAQIALEVSRYAATRPHEFVAETFAGLMSGKTYSAPVMILYKAQGGVIPSVGIEKLEIADPWAEAMNTVGKRVAAGNAPKYADLTKPRDMLHESMPDTTPDGRKVPALPQKLDDRAQLAGFLHDLGIQGLDFGKGLPDGIGEYAAPILRRMYAQGFPMPRSFNVKPFPPDQLGPGETSEGVVAWYNGSDDSLNVNSATSEWDKYSGGKVSAVQKLKAEAETQHDMGFWSTPDAEHAVVHEMGHLLNKRIMDEVGMDTLNKQLDDASGKYSRAKLGQIVGEVSRYSASGVAEFVAETFTGLYSGKKYSQDVMAMYKAAGGPPVTWRDGSPIVDFSARFRLSDPLVRIPMAMQVLEV